MPPLTSAATEDDCARVRYLFNDPNFASPQPRLLPEIAVNHRHSAA
jgi:uncharacterized protein YigA (DUF484 family)